MSTSLKSSCTQQSACIIISSTGELTVQRNYIYKLNIGVLQMNLSIVHQQVVAVRYLNLFLYS